LVVVLVAVVVWFGLGTSCGLIGLGWVWVS